MAAGRFIGSLAEGIAARSSGFIQSQPNQRTLPTAQDGNLYGVRTTPIDAGATLSKTYHGLSITAGNTNNIVGRIQSWQANMYSRAGVHIFEVGVLSFARPVDYVPGNGQNYSLTCTRTELWGNELEVAFGMDFFVDLVAQQEPFSVDEAWFQGDLTRAPYMKFHYSTCWFAEKNQAQFGAEGDAKVTIDATINFVARTRVV